jgi:hypothetical protein
MVLYTQQKTGKPGTLKQNKVSKALSFLMQKEAVFYKTCVRCLHMITERIILYQYIKYLFMRLTL